MRIELMEAQRTCASLASETAILRNRLEGRDTEYASLETKTKMTNALRETTSEEVNGKYFKSEESVHRVMESTVVDISIPPPSFKPVSLSLSRISFYSKTPKQVFFLTQ